MGLISEIPCLPVTVSIGEPDEFQVVVFFFFPFLFLTLNNVVLWKSHCQVFVRKILLFKEYMWKMKHSFLKI